MTLTEQPHVFVVARDEIQARQFIANSLPTGQGFGREMIFNHERDAIIMAMGENTEKLRSQRVLELWDENRVWVFRVQFDATRTYR